MKYFIGWFAVWALLSLGCKEKVTTVNFKDWPEEKSYPYDPFFIQRSYPDKHFSVRAYQEALQKVQLDQLSESPTRFDGTWTVQGPGNLGARINTIAAVPNSSTVYVGFANGGVWKTLDGGGSWFPIFDDRLFLTVGDIAIDPNDTSTIYVGTGDPNITSYPAMGNGVFKSTDGGQSWSYLGLSETAITSKIIINPNNSNQIFVATMGLPFERNPDRGLYRSDDGGQTWQKVLYLSNQAGVIDLVMDPDHPNVLYASGWDRIRNNQESIVYGPHAKIFKSTDGGNNWATLTNGLPQNISCRIGLTICESQPNILYALYVGTDFQVSGIYKSTDGGVNWTAKGLAGLENALGGFGWYFGQIRVDPDDPDLLYVLGGYNWRSTDGGNSWQTFYAHPGHPDKHDLIFYENGLMIATDGGLYRSVDDAETLIRMDQIPANEVYRVGYNPFKPDLYYCGMQDNGTAYGHQSNINGWLIYYGGDGFQPQFSPLDSNLFYAESQYGNIGRTQDGQGLNLFGYSDYSSDRRNWDLPYMLSYFHSNVLYLGTYRAYQYDTLNLTFTTISGDLTDGNIYGDIFHSITTIDESHFVEGQLYVGTSDANVQRRNPDGSWQNITSGLPERYVTSIKTSESQAGRVFVTHSGYRDNEF
ncbi:MAG TPA: exo-alpha-sialidase, partial [Saprospiraceae bacterium]|nr:exo-alpha-sialidase [Saprospiraceae bacterium]